MTKPKPVFPLFLFLIALIFLLFNCDNSTQPAEPLSDDEIYIYTTRHYNVYRIDPNTYELAQTITIPTPTIDLFAVTFSQDSNYLVFNASDRDVPDTHQLLTYDLVGDTVVSLFDTGIPYGWRETFPGDNPDQPGLIYLFSSNSGLWAIDVLAEEVKGLISAEHQVGLTITMKYSADGQYVGVLEALSTDNAKGQIEIYATGTGLAEPITTLNNDNVDSIYVYDFEFSENGREVYVIYRFTNQASEDFGIHIGAYEVATKTLTTYDIENQFSRPRGCAEYSPKRKELYFLENREVFCIIDTHAGALADTVRLEGINDGSRIGLIREETVALVTCGYNDVVAVIDLEARKLTHRIPLPDPHYILVR